MPNYDNEDTVPIGDAIREALGSVKVQPDWVTFWIGAVFNFVIGPLATWIALAAADVLPKNIFGFLAVVSIVGLVRLCMFDRGLAEMPQIAIPLEKTND